MQSNLGLIVTKATPLARTALCCRTTRELCNLEARVRLITLSDIGLLRGSALDLRNSIRILLIPRALALLLTFSGRVWQIDLYSSFFADISFNTAGSNFEALALHIGVTQSFAT